MTSVQLSVTVFLGILSLGLSICPPLETDVSSMPDCANRGFKMECDYEESARLCEVRCLLPSGNPRVRFTCESGQEVVGSDGRVSCSDEEVGESGEATDGTTEEESTTEPATDPATEPATDPATEPATDPATEPATDPATDPATEPATEPATTAVISNSNCPPDGFEGAQDKDGDVSCTSNFLRNKRKFRNVPSSRLCVVKCYFRRSYAGISFGPKRFSDNGFAGCAQGYKVAKMYPHSNRYMTCV